MKRPFFYITMMLLVLMVTMGFTQNHILKQITFSKTSHDGYPYWSPDGKFIIYSSGNQKTCHIKKIPAQGGKAELLTDIFAQHAQWSPDGHYIVFDGKRGTIMQIMSAQGGTPILLNTGNIPISRSGMPCWSPDSKQIAFASKGTIYTMDLASGACQKIFEQENKGALPFDWTADGTQIIADFRDTVDKSKSDIWMISIKDKKAKQLSFLNGRQVKPHLSPDGTMILFTSNHGGNADLWIMPAQGGEPVQITFYKGSGKNPGYDIEGSWSPDGKRIAFSSTRSGYWAIWVMELDLNYIKSKIK